MRPYLRGKYLDERRRRSPTVAEAVIDDYIAAAGIELQNLPARIAGNDLLLRRRVERVIFEARDAISGRLAEKARQALPEGAVDNTGATDAEDAEPTIPLGTAS
jgi:hypothetical protein